MGNVMAGLGLALLGVIFFQVAQTFFFYPAKTEVNSGWAYYALKGTAYILFGVGAIFIVMAYL